MQQRYGRLACLALLPAVLAMLLPLLGRPAQAFTSRALASAGRKAAGRCAAEPAAKSRGVVRAPFLEPALARAAVTRLFSATTDAAAAAPATAAPTAAGAAEGEEAAGAAAKGEVTELSRLEIRVGKIVDIARHPDADTLYVEQIDVGEAEGPRTIVSGLVKYQSEEAMKGRDVIVLCNLKPRAMRGVTSHGMLLCASNEDHSEVVPLAPPAGAAVGDLITVEGHASAPEPPGNRAGKAYDRVADDLFVDEEGRATFKGLPFMVAAGAVTGAIKKGKIS